MSKTMKLSLKVRETRFHKGFLKLPPTVSKNGEKSNQQNQLESAKEME